MDEKIHVGLQLYLINPTHKMQIDLRKLFHLLFQDLIKRRSSLQFPFLQADDHRKPKHILYLVQRVQKV